MTLLDFYHIFVACVTVGVVYYWLKLKYGKPMLNMSPPKEELPKLNLSHEVALTVCKRVCSFIGLGSICHALAMRGKIELIMQRNHNYANYAVTANFKYDKRETRFMVSHIIEDVFYIHLIIRYNSKTAPVRLILNNEIFTFTREEIPELDTCW